MRRHLHRRPRKHFVTLRADMDALPMQAELGLAYAVQNGNCHSCGHDCHTAMVMDESALPGGAAACAHYALRRLQEHTNP